MWGQKAARIADLEARLAVALRDREPAADTTQDNALRSELAGARTAVRARDARIGLLQRQVDQLIRRLGEYADRGIANGERADRTEATLTAVREAVAEAIMCADASCLTGSHLPKIERLLGGVGLLGQQPAAEPGPRCVCGDPIQLMDDDDPASWIHSPGSDTRCLDARPAGDPCAHGCRDAADEHARLSQELDAGEVRP